ncbi:MAG: hypothetical protein CBB97_15615 [Candidatus Endolissoclinum sp. TMED37]|nr:MAG: hypothetical protein CBB97_15615 [Candidatus Endolissoclinum sp. TMED37]|tara:strand:- start:835 stop:1092 length:258 start_codon:yes stop_codon:yes gene_type:complete
MVIKSNSKIVYDSWNDGSDVYKDKKGYYVIQWNPKTSTEYKKYLRKSWKPSNINKTKKNRKQKRKTKKKIKKKKQTKKINKYIFF